MKLELVGGVRIGVLGGIGPEATAEFYSKLISRLQERKLIKSNKDFPQIIINSIPASELIRKKISEEDLKPYIKGLKELEKFNVDFIIMICNTIHLFYNKLQKEVKIPILNLRGEIKRELKKRKVKSEFVIGTPLTINKNLYKFKEIKYSKPNKKETNQLSEAIFNFNKGKKKKEQIRNVKEICKKYLKKVDVVILGCTEFAVMLRNEKFPKINTIDVLVNATLKKFISFKNQGGFNLT